MSNQVVIRVENVSKKYQLGQFGTGTISHDLNRWWYRFLGKEDPYQKIGETNDRTKKSESGYIWALKDISFDVVQGEVLGIIGRNGAGKSTLLKILSKITSPSFGTIHMKGRIASLLEVGTGFHPEMTGRENIFMNGTIMGMTRHEIRAKLDEIVEFAGVTMYIDTPVKRYSSGMKVRLGFAIAAHLEPEILIVDEVLAVGDAEFQKKAIGKMKEVSQGQGRTVLFVSHNMASIERLCTHALVMENGLLSFRGTVEDSLQYYLTHTGQVSKMPLSQRTDRRNRQRFQFTDFGIENIDGVSLESLTSGMSCKFILDYSLSISLKIIGIRVLISDDRGVNRILLNTGLVAKTPKLFRKTDSGGVVFMINELPLPKGIYFIRLSCYSEDGVEDDIEEAAMFEVAGGDFYGFGKEAVVTDGVLIKFDAEC